MKEDEAKKAEQELKKIKKVLILGSGGLQIGQAGEFDYSGSQAIKSLKSYGIETVLVNSNIATVQTARGLADKVYSLPVTVEFLTKILEKERPDGILLGFGGQTALNAGVDLYNSGVLEKMGVKVLGTSVETIVIAEDRGLFKESMQSIGVNCIPSEACTTSASALAAAGRLGYPVIVRSAFSLGGLGSGFADNEAELTDLVKKAFSMVPQVLVEKSIKGWREVEYEVVRDRFDNAVTVCNMENFDPMGVHTGESIVIAPSQTLTNSEYHNLRLVSLSIVRKLNIIGECNVQLALDPNSDNYYVIEVNPRLSRSSALASKATGYPLAAVAAQINMGMALPDIVNRLTQVTSACFEPSLDYVVVKMPRWDMEKFPHVNRNLGSAMKSVGEVMAIGKSFLEALQKACRMADTSNKGFECPPGVEARYFQTNKELEQELRKPTPLRIYALALALDRGYTLEQLHALTSIDRWWLQGLVVIHLNKIDLQQLGVRHKDDGQRVVAALDKALLLRSKQNGFSDLQIASYLFADEACVRKRRIELGVLPWMKQIDTLAAEFPATTNYLYATYSGKEHDVLPETCASTIVLGSGVYRIGSSVEFDHGAVSAVRTIRELGRKSIMINYNPETVSTDYDESDRLYFEELSQERVQDIYDFENQCSGVVVSLGGQIPQNLAVSLSEAGLPVLGTSPLSIDRCENREKFSRMLEALKVTQPAWLALSSVEAAQVFASKVGYPVLIRPSYCLSGAAMRVCYSSEALSGYLAAAAAVSPEYPVVVTKFYEQAEEIEFDAVAADGKILVWAVSEHVEEAGTHSGDASLVFPAKNLPQALHDKLFQTSQSIAHELKISGPFSVQYLYKNDELAVIECNLRSSRSFPFVARALDVDFFRIAVLALLGEDTRKLLTREIRCEQALSLPYFSVKVPQFSFARLPGSDPITGVEMASTGEVACYHSSWRQAFLQARLASGFRRPETHVLISGAVPASFRLYVAKLQALGLKVSVTAELRALETADVALVSMEKARQDISEGVYDMLICIQSDVAQNAEALSDPSSERILIEQLRKSLLDLRALKNTSTLNLSAVEKALVDVTSSGSAHSLSEQQRLLRRAATDFNVTTVTNYRQATTIIDCLTDERAITSGPPLSYGEFMGDVQTATPRDSQLTMNISGRHS